jgi:hypothetical protein
VSITSQKLFLNASSSRSETQTNHCVSAFRSLVAVPENLHQSLNPIAAALSDAGSEIAQSFLKDTVNQTGNQITCREN